MIKNILLTLTFLATPVIASEETPCDAGNCGDVRQDQQQGMTNANSPTFNSTPNMNMSGSNVMIQNNMDAISRMGEIQCANNSFNFGGYGNRAKSETNPSLYDNHSESYGVNAQVSIPWGESHNTCLKAQKVQLNKMEWAAQEANIRMCVDMISLNYQISDQLKSNVPELALCDHIRKVQQTNPKQYEAMISSLQQENTQLQAKVAENTVEKSVVGYKEYRVRFVDYINGCKTGCNGKYNSLRDYLSDIKSGFNGEEYNLYAEPYNNDSRVSVYIRKGFLIWSQAEKVRQHFVSMGFAVKVVGVKGTEIYK